MMAAASLHTASLSSSSTLLQDRRSRLPVRSVLPISAFNSRRSYLQIRASFTDFSASPNTGGRIELDALSSYSEVVPDTVVFDDFERFPPTAASVSSSLLLGICSLPDTAFKGAVDTALADKQCYGLETPEARMTCFVNKALVNIGGELSKLVPGHVSTEVDARLAYETHAIVGKVENLLHLYNSIDVLADRLLFKIPATWQGIEAARLLESEGIQTHMTFVYSKRLRVWSGMDEVGVSPVKEVAVSVDAFIEEEYASQSKLYKEFTNMSTFDKAWTYKSPSGMHILFS